MLLATGVHALRPPEAAQLYPAFWPVSSEPHAIRPVTTGRREHTPRLPTPRRPWSSLDHRRPSVSHPHQRLSSASQPELHPPDPWHLCPLGP